MFSDDPRAYVKIRNRQPYYDAGRPSWSGGYARHFSGLATVFSNAYNGTTSDIVTAVMHELGHAIFGFNDILLGANGPPGIMNYNTLWNVPMPNFNQSQRNIIKNSIWGQ
jgi:hypothetical protein